MWQEPRPDSHSHSSCESHWVVPCAMYAFNGTARLSVWFSQCGLGIMGIQLRCPIWSSLLVIVLSINGYGSKLGTPKLWMVNTKLDIHICGPTSVFHFDPHPNQHLLLGMSSVLDDHWWTLACSLLFESSLLWISYDKLLTFARTFAQSPAQGELYHDRLMIFQ